MTQIQRMSARAVVWLAFAFASALLLVTVVNTVGLSLTVLLDTIGIVALSGLLVTILSEKYL